MKNYFFKARCAAIILITAGYGWADGHYSLANSSIVTYLVQFIVIAALVVTGIISLSVTKNDRNKNYWSVTAFSIFSALSLLMNIVNVIHDAGNSHINPFGSYHTFADAVPVIFLIIGNLLWLITIVGSNGGSEKDKYLGEEDKYLFKNRYNIL